MGLGPAQRTVVNYHGWREPRVCSAPLCFHRHRCHRVGGSIQNSHKCLCPSTKEPISVYVCDRVVVCMEKEKRAELALRDRFHALSMLVKCKYSILHRLHTHDCPQVICTPVYALLLWGSTLHIVHLKAVEHLNL